MPVAEPAAMTTSQQNTFRVYHRVFPSVFVLAAALCVASPARAEDNFLTVSPWPNVNNPPRMYLTLGLGGAATIGPGGMLSGTVAGEHFQFTARVAGAAEFTILEPAGTSVREYGFMAGYGQSTGVAHFYAVAGLGMISVDRRGREIPHSGDWSWTDYERVKEDTFSVPIQVGVDFGRSIVGGGLAIMANLNPSQSYVGLLLTLNLGKLR
jgi:hypothetical protein